MIGKVISPGAGVTMASQMLPEGRLLRWIAPAASERATSSNPCGSAGRTRRPGAHLLRGVAGLIEQGGVFEVGQKLGMLLAVEDDVRGDPALTCIRPLVDRLELERVAAPLHDLSLLQLYRTVHPVDRYRPA